MLGLDERAQLRQSLDDITSDQKESLDDFEFFRVDEGATSSPFSLLSLGSGVVKDLSSTCHNVPHQPGQEAFVAVASYIRGKLSIPVKGIVLRLVTRVEWLSWLEQLLLAQFKFDHGLIGVVIFLLALLLLDGLVNRP